jgi:hypothetical protein
MLLYFLSWLMIPVTHLIWHSTFSGSALRCQIIYFFKIHKTMTLGWCLTTVVDNLITQYTYCILTNFLLNGSNLDNAENKGINQQT